MSGSDDQRGHEDPGDGTAHDLAGSYALDAVDGAERARFESHLAGCEECRRTVAELTEAAAGLSAGLETDPPQRLRERLLAAVADEPQETASHGSAAGDRAAAAGTADHRGTVSSLEHRRVARRSRWWLAAAAAAAVAIGGVVVTQWGQDDPGATVAVQEVLEADDAQWSTETVDGSTLHVVRSEQLQRTVLVAEEMPEAPQGQDYQLWYVHEDGTAVSAGLMPKDGDEETQLVLEGDPAGAGAVGVTLEPEGGSEQPTSEPLVAIPLEG